MRNKLLIFIFLFRFFSDFEQKKFSDFWPKNFKMFSKLPSTCPKEQFAAFFSKSFEPFSIFCRNLYDGSQNSIYVSRVKIAEEIVFFVFLFRISLGFWAKSFSVFWPKNFKNLWKLPSACPQEQLETLNFFKWFWTVLDFLQKHLSWFSKFYIRVQSKKCGKNSLFLFSFQNFFRILTENFSDFWPKNFKKFSKLPSTCPVEQSVAWSFFLKFWIVLYFLHKPSAWFPKLYLRVQSKNCGRNSFLIFLFRIFSDSERNSSDFRPKNVKNLSKLPYACPEEQFVAWNFF